jgi:heme/copper-type cytochrome/quinol oxidase subunit 2
MRTIWAPIILIVLFATPMIQLVFASETPGEYVNRAQEIWNLFFRMMTIAFVVGGVIAGTIVWQVWRFRESNPNAKPTPYEDKGDL